MQHMWRLETGDLDRLFGGHGHVLVQISIPAQQSVGRLVGPHIQFLCKRDPEYWKIRSKK